MYQNLSGVGGPASGLTDASLPSAEPPSVTARNAAVPSATLKLSEALIVRRRVFRGCRTKGEWHFR
jgi:hypothetical protein